VCGDDIGHENRITLLELAQYNSCVANVRMLLQDVLDLARLDSKASDLQLAIQPAEILDVAAWEKTNTIPGSIETIARAITESVGDEPFGGQDRIT
jgi:hypothetical protein